MNLQTIRTAARELGVSEASVRKAVADGRLKTLPLGNRRLVDLDTARNILSPPSGLNIGALSVETGLNRAAIYRGVREGWIPCQRDGRSLIFQLDEVLAALKKRMDTGRG